MSADLREDRPHTLASAWSPSKPVKRAVGCSRMTDDSRNLLLPGMPECNIICPKKKKKWASQQNDQYHHNKHGNLMRDSRLWKKPSISFHLKTGSPPLWPSLLVSAEHVPARSRPHFPPSGFTHTLRQANSALLLSTAWSTAGSKQHKPWWEDIIIIFLSVLNVCLQNYGHIVD